MAKILCIGDIHFKTSNIAQTEGFEKEVEDILNENPDLDFVVVLGDILDSFNIYHEAPFNQAISFLRMLSSKILTFLLIGNHDYPNNSQFLSDKHAFNALKLWGENMVVVDTEVSAFEIRVGTRSHFEAKNDDVFLFYFVPYVPPGTFIKALDLTEDVWEHADVIFAHQEFKGCKLGPIRSIEGDEWKEDNPTVISGHIHESHWVGENVFYTGSAIQQGYASDENHLILLDVNRNENGETEIIMTPLELNMRKKKLLNLAIGEAEKLNFGEYKNTDLKVCLKGTNSEHQSFRKSDLYKKMVKQGIKVSFKHEFVTSKNELTRLIQESSCRYGTKYNEVLYGMVRDSNDKKLEDMYKEVIGEKKE